MKKKTDPAPDPPGFIDETPVNPADLVPGLVDPRTLNPSIRDGHFEWIPPRPLFPWINAITLAAAKVLEETPHKVLGFSPPLSENPFAQGDAYAFLRPILPKGTPRRVRYAYGAIYHARHILLSLDLMGDEGTKLASMMGGNETGPGSWIQVLVCHSMMLGVAANRLHVAALEDFAESKLEARHTRREAARRRYAPQRKKWESLQKEVDKLLAEPDRLPRPSLRELAKLLEPTFSIPWETIRKHIEVPG